jgi:hypothetical protein
MAKVRPLFDLEVEFVIKSWQYVAGLTFH